MLESMTGFGKASDTYGNKKITAEIKSLNSKQFDLNVKAPSLYREKELELRAGLQQSLGRGKVDLTIYTESPEGDRHTTINKELALNYISQLRELGRAAGVGSDADLLPTVMTLPEVLQTERPELDPDEWQAVMAVIGDATDQLLRFRRHEGRRLGDDIATRIESICRLRTKVEAHLPERLKAVRDRLEKNLKEFVDSEQTDRNRLEQEIVYYLEKLDITEENVRLEGHCTYFLETMKDDRASTGKKLAFISQEIGREINTMGSKANYVPIQKPVVEMKDELEKIKEQLLNIR